MQIAPSELWVLKINCHIEPPPPSERKVIQPYCTMVNLMISVWITNPHSCKCMNSDVLSFFLFLFLLDYHIVTKWISLSQPWNLHQRSLNSMMKYLGSLLYYVLGKSHTRSCHNKFFPSHVIRNNQCEECGMFMIISPLLGWSKLKEMGVWDRTSLPIIVVWSPTILVVAPPPHN